MATQRTPKQGNATGTSENGSARSRAAADAKKAAGPASVHRLRILLSESDPEIWREVEVPSEIRLDRLHRVIQAVMGWTDSHLHQFMVGDECIADIEAVDDARDETSVRLSQVAPAKGSAFLYVYDLGDDWQHEITVERVDPCADSSATVRCTGGERACPPEDCGGICGYEDLLRVLRDPGDDEHVAMRELVGAKFDPESFDLTAANRRLKQVK
jgi:hypothetical protein